LFLNGQLRVLLAIHRLFDDGTSVGVGTTTPTSGFLFDVNTTAIVRTYFQAGSFTKGANQTGTIITNGLIQSSTGLNLAPVTTTDLNKNGLYPSGNTIQFWAGNNQIGGFGLISASGGQYGLYEFTFTPSATPSSPNAGILNALRVKANVSKQLNVTNTTNQTQIIIDPIINQVNGTGTANGTLRGIYYNPTITALGGSTHIAWQNASGDIIFGNFSGSALSGRVLQVDTNGKVGVQDGSFTLYSGTSNDIVTAQSNSVYQYGQIANGNDLVIDITNNLTYFRAGGQPNGLSMGLNTLTAQVGTLQNATGVLKTYLEFSGANNTIEAWDETNGVGNGLGIYFGTNTYLFGNYRISDGLLSIDATNHTLVLGQSNYNTSGSMEFQAYELKLTGTNLETATPPTGVTPLYLKVTINGVPYLIEALAP
jgi:hypothetical protein